MKILNFKKNNTRIKKILISMLLLYSTSIFAKDIFYQVEPNDQLGMIFLSLGHPNLWSTDGKINQFKKTSNFKYLDTIKPGQLLTIQDSDVNFKNNVIINDDHFKFKNKIWTNAEFLELQKNEGQNSLEQTQKSESVKINLSDVTDYSQSASEKNLPTQEKTEVLNQRNQQSLDLYLGAGAFIASDNENDRDVLTNTMTGLQPLVQIKAIYSNEFFGSVALDLLTKKIISDKFSFPINLDYRVQYLPKWNISDSCKLAISYSFLQHSYVGKNSDIEIPYELKTSFLGIGLVFPQDNFWFEFYIEKAYQGTTKSVERSQLANSGMRIDTELVYPLYKTWKILPGLNYYQLKDSTANYTFSVYEARLTVAHEFEF